MKLTNICDSKKCALASALACMPLVATICLGSVAFASEKPLVVVKKVQATDSDSNAAISISVNDEKLQSFVNTIVSRSLEGVNQALAQIDGKKIEIAADRINDVVASVDVNEIRETVRRAMEDANIATSWSYSSRGDEVAKGSPYSSREKARACSLAMVKGAHGKSCDSRTARHASLSTIQWRSAHISLTRKSVLRVRRVSTKMRSTIASNKCAVIGNRSASRFLRPIAASR
jgi:hypothetical protein